MALNRLGVPANMINMIHVMEVEGITIVRTPLTQYIYTIPRGWKVYDDWTHSSLGSSYSRRGEYLKGTQGAH